MNIEDFKAFLVSKGYTVSPCKGDELVRWVDGELVGVVYSDFTTNGGYAGTVIKEFVQG